MVRSILSNWVAVAVSGVIAFLITPTLIHGLGDFQYGMWILVASILDHYGLLDVGIRTTLQRYVARFYGAEDRAALNQTLITALTFAGIVCAVIAAMTIGLSAILPGFFKVTGAERVVFARLVLLSGFAVAIAFPARVLGAYLCGLQRFDLFSLASIVNSVVRAGLLLLVLRLGYGVLGCGAVNLCMSVLSMVLQIGLIRLADPQVSLRWHHGTLRRARELFSFSIYIFVHQAGDYLRFHLDSFVIARWLDISLVTPFNVAARLIDYLRTGSGSMMGPVLTAMSTLEAQTKERQLRQLFLRATKMAALFTFFVGSLLYWNGPTLLRLWVGNKFVSSYSLLVVLLAGHVVALSQAPSIMLLVAKGKNRPLAWWTAGEGLANLALSIYWAPRMGIVGVALGTVVPMLFSKLVLQPWYTLHVMGMSFRDYLLRGLVRPLLVCGSFFAMVSFLPGVAVQQAKILSFLVSIGWQSALYGALILLIGLTTEERTKIWQRVRRGSPIQAAPRPLTTKAPLRDSSEYASL